MFVLSWAAALLLGAAGTAKLASPAGTVRALRATRTAPPARLNGVTGVAAVRTVGAAELAIAVSVIGLGGRWPALALTGAYVVLAGVATRLLAVAPGADCGCFGARRSPSSRWHLVVDGAGVAAGLLGAVAPTRDLPGELGALHQPLAAGAAVAGTLLLAGLAYQLMTSLPELEAARLAVAGTR